MGKNQSYNKRAYGQRNSKGGRPWNLEVVTAHPAEVDKTTERGLSVNKILASPTGGGGPRSGGGGVPTKYGHSPSQLR